MLSLRFLLVALLASCSAAFVVQPTTVSSSSTTSLHSTFHHDDFNDNNDAPLDVQPLAELGPLALKMAGVLTIKTAKDMVNYPPQLFDQLTRSASGKNEMNPVVMLAKLMGVLVFKMAHDAVYFPMVWTQRMVECQSLDECDVE
ncbi:expressed unknown protein [Seminavis robusta]|uniref:Uncharacterized protein n=1 Tax=Seminavis robusta TaxID=568900 RepID=A0A9N8DHH1_9STRA|nr:expressed unknown protein [Seminavis robusta]|eukprot:Sro123_g059690.1 n/a (144) ;mRNA; f:89491-89922